MASGKNTIAKCHYIQNGPATVIDDVMAGGSPPARGMTRGGLADAALVESVEAMPPVAPVIVVRALRVALGLLRLPGTIILATVLLGRTPIIATGTLGVMP